MCTSLAAYWVVAVTASAKHSRTRISFAQSMRTPLTTAVIANGVAKIADLLACRGTEQKRLHARAAEAAKSYFGPRVFMRGVVELSNFCRENCAYCGMRRDNRSLDRFRARLDDISEW